MDKKPDPQEYDAFVLLDTDLIVGKDGGKNIRNAHVFDAHYDNDEGKVKKLARRSRCNARTRLTVTKENRTYTNYKLLAKNNDEERARRLLAELQSEFEYEICGQCVATFYSSDEG